MAFLLIPVVYVEVDPEEDEDNEISQIRKKKARPPDVKEGNLTINTNQICYFTGNKEIDHTFIYMSDGQTWECVLSLEKFTDLLSKSDSIVYLSTIIEN